MTQFWAEHEFTTPIPTDAASIARGRHLAVTRGCTGCHGENLQGTHMDPDLPWYLVRLVAPNIAQLAKHESPAKLEAAIRQGIRHDGRALIVMPSAMFSHLTDQDTADLIALLRATPAKENPLPRPYLGPLAYIGIFNGGPDRQTAPELVAQQPHLARQADPNPQIRLGEYTAITSCSECHGPQLHGVPVQGPGQPPDLAGARGYSHDDFIKLMRTGVPVGGRKLAPLMDLSAKFRFSNFTDEEVNAVYAYLKTVPPAPQ